MNCTSDLTPVSTFNTGAPGTEVDYPIAKATLEVYRVRGQLRALWFVRVCPVCFGEHRHGAGAGEVNPLFLLSHRAGPCRIPNRGYILVDADPVRTAALVEQLGLENRR